MRAQGRADDLPAVSRAAASRPTAPERVSPICRKWRTGCRRSWRCPVTSAGRRSSASSCDGGGHPCVRVACTSPPSGRSGAGAPGRPAALPDRDPPPRRRADACPCGNRERPDQHGRSLLEGSHRRTDRDSRPGPRSNPSARKLRSSGSVRRSLLTASSASPRSPAPGYAPRPARITATTRPLSASRW